MRKSKFSESQIVEILQEAEGGVPVAELLRKHGISRPTFFKWRSKYGGATVSDVKRLRELETENARLKRMYADLALENAAIKLRTSSTESCRAVRKAAGRCGARRRASRVRAAGLPRGEAVAGGVLPASKVDGGAGRRRD